MIWIFFLILVMTNWKEILYDSSAKCIEKGTLFMKDNPQLFPELKALMLEQNGSISQRASRVINHLIRENPILYKKELELIYSKIEKIQDESVLFNMMKIYTEVDLPKSESKRGKLFNFCLNMLETNVNRIVLKHYSAEILVRFCDLYPEFANELYVILKRELIIAQASLKGKLIKLIAILEQKYNAREMELY